MKSGKTSRSSQRRQNDESQHPEQELGDSQIPDRSTRLLKNGKTSKVRKNDESQLPELKELTDDRTRMTDKRRRNSNSQQSTRISIVEEVDSHIGVSNGKRKRKLSLKLRE